MSADLEALLTRIAACRVCAGRMEPEPRPVVQAARGARILIVGQAPGAKVHASGVPWDDASGARLRDWLGLSEAVFHDPTQVAMAPMGFCYPGKGASGDRPPRPECAPLWQAPFRAALPDIRLTLLIGTYAQAWHLPRTPGADMTARVRAFRDLLPDRMPLPHPSWRVTLWMRKNPWFEAEALPAVRAAVAAALAGPPSAGP
ncbi:MAG: uracil-DNA glycosylase family protein [Phenylobacterium sp.]|uniref:uracil-DNA glycosylase family protein n=1 Tax=Phenylobacterium sp. TaxID=1871053 RepID=UPI0026006102|nr:uracil-DNA glycosylase family protein [Phenylobacterium sp.]MBI1199846.1 uracil-DNA glycosylase family protein [Phenylobacterium sp.]